MRVLDRPTALFVKITIIVPPGILFTNPSPLEWESVRMPFGQKLVEYPPHSSTNRIDQEHMIPAASTQSHMTLATVRDPQNTTCHGRGRIQSYRRTDGSHRLLAIFPRLPKDHLSIRSSQSLDGPRAQSMRCFRLASSHASRS